jgi:hypothetical protein
MYYKQSISAVVFYQAAVQSSTAQHSSCSCSYIVVLTLLFHSFCW